MKTEPDEQTTKFVHVGDYIAELDVELIYDSDSSTGWGPYVSHEDALKLDRLRRALKHGDIPAAAREARVYRVQQVAAE